MNHFPELVKNHYDGYIEFFVREFKFIYLCYLRLSFWRFILFLWLGHVSLFLHVTCSCVLGCVHLEKKVISFSLYRFASYREKTSSVSQTRDLGNLSNLFWKCVISGLVFFQDFLVSWSLWCPSMTLQILWHCWKSLSSGLFSVALRYSKCAMPVRALSHLRHKPVPQAALHKAGMFDAGGSHRLGTFS